MSGELVVQQATDSWVPVLGAVGDLASKLAATQFVPRAMQRQPASVAAAILTGREMGLGPMASLRGIDVIEGRPALTAQMLAARILAAGHRIEWVSATDRQCTVRIERGDGLSNAEATWTLADAQRAGLAGKKVWQSYPRHMLRARALSECAAMACPDVALGLDVLDQPDEHQRPVPGPVSVVQIAGGNAQHGEGSAQEMHLSHGLEPSTPAHGGPPAATGDGAAEGPGTTLPAAESPPDDGSEADKPHGGADVMLATPAQLRKMNAILTELERVDGRKFDRAERRAMILTLAGAEGLESAKELTRDQASKAIEALDRAVGAAMEPPQDDRQEEGEVVDAVIVEEQ